LLRQTSDRPSKKAMLVAGGTKHHTELLKPFGLDARETTFWKNGLGLLDGMITELEGMEK